MVHSNFGGKRQMREIFDNRYHLSPAQIAAGITIDLYRSNLVDVLTQSLIK